MNNKIKSAIIAAILVIVAVFVYLTFSTPSNIIIKQNNENINSTPLSQQPKTIATTTFSNPVISVESKPKPIITPPTKTSIPEPIKEVSPKSFDDLINSSVIQLYCGYLNDEKTNFSDINRGTGIIIDSKGEILTNRHIIWDENLKKTRTDCFVLKSPFPNAHDERPKIYYTADIVKYPPEEKFNEAFSKDKYYNDFAILKIISKPNIDSKINLLLGFDYALESDYFILEDNGIFNFLPIDWNYQPKTNDNLITLGYGVDASHAANQITSTVGRLYGNIDINKTLKPQILLIESNATAGFSGGALINPKSKDLIGLISWITSGDETGKYTVAIFRDFLSKMMLNELDFNLETL